MTPRRFEDGLEDDSGVEDGQPLSVDGVRVTTSTNAGSYYCAHAFFMLARWAERTPEARGVGFLHVPADPETTGDGRPQARRHDATHAVVAAALRGLLDHEGADELRVLLTGYGPFQGVVDNPTGAFVGAAPELQRALLRATGQAPSALPPLRDAGHTLPLWRSGRLVLAALVLEVSDRSLDADAPGSLPWALASFAPHYALSMGVHRKSDAFRVELLPTNAGLTHDERSARHAPGVPATTLLRQDHTLARAIERGARSLKLT